MHRDGTRTLPLGAGAPGHRGGLRRDSVARFLDAGGCDRSILLVRGLVDVPHPQRSQGGPGPLLGEPLRFERATPRSLSDPRPWEWRGANWAEHLPLGAWLLDRTNSLSPVVGVDDIRRTANQGDVRAEGVSRRGSRRHGRDTRLDRTSCNGHAVRFIPRNSGWSLLRCLPLSASSNAMTTSNARPRMSLAAFALFFEITVSSYIETEPAPHARPRARTSGRRWPVNRFR